MIRKVLFSTQKNEGPFLLEWVAYHKAIGFTDLVIVSNDCSDGSDHLLDALAAAKVVHHIRQEVPAGVAPQFNARDIVLREQLFRAGDWVIWLDLDEFFVPDDRFKSMAPLTYWLQKAGAEALALNWRIMGDSGQVGLPERFVSRAFQGTSRAAHVVNQTVKTFFRWSEKVQNLHLHRPLWNPDLPAPKVLLGNGKPSDNSFIFELHRNGSPESRVDFAGQRYVLGQINHYSIRTRDLFQLKAQRGRGAAAANGPSRHNQEFYDQNNTNDTTNDRILARLPATDAMLARLLDLPGVAQAHQATVAHVLAQIRALD
ncbi:glycosyltransferase family 2 protein [Neogemmobacter tilapiae]|uniref:Glycosyltransferase family 2 protein n=1 Tax=Neogemmobacter tilapiae TaxID=875041 RepID=A0A918TL87_9RHOB|nr:glycosyltransferase family 2 protein [Gemmobacter tilapiae]GHC52859.1 hypothetical protein GCM10007315_14300 [Gemmobacter tilapiae]